MSIGYPSEVMDREREVRARDTNVFLVGAVTAEYS